MPRRATYQTLLTTLVERAELPSHPAPHALTLEVAEVGLLRHDVSVHRADLVAEAVEKIGLLLEVLVLRVHLAQLALSSLEA